MRERLVGVLKEKQTHGVTGYANFPTISNGELADHLLANNIFAFTCKPGDKAYFVIEDTEEIYVSAEEITDVSTKGFFVNGDCELNLYSDIGKTVFLNPEDADAECERLRNSKTEKDYDFEEICPRCDFVNEVVWDGKSRTVICAGCGKEIVLCSACEDMRCGNCRYEKELSKNGGVQDNE